MSTVSRVTPPPPSCTWGHKSTGLSDPTSQTLDLGSHVPQFKGNLTPRPKYCSCKSTVSSMIPVLVPLTLDHTCRVSRESPLPKCCTFESPSTVPRVTPPPRPCTCGCIIDLHGYPTSQDPVMGSHVLSLQGDPSQTLHLVSHVHSLPG